jgi:hypothetical protein
MTHASLFIGIGGFDYAAALLGWINIFDCEIDAFCRISGSSRIAAYKMCFDFWGTEIDEEYFNMQEKRFREECFGEVRLKNGDVYVQKELFEL